MWSDPFVEVNGDRVTLTREAAIELEFGGAQDVETREHADYLLVGYLVPDDDCTDPFEICDGLGRIFHASERAYRDQLGLDQYFERNRAPDPNAVLLVSGGATWYVDETPPEEFDFAGVRVREGQAIWVADGPCRDSVDYNAVCSMLPEGTKVEYRSDHNPDGTVRRLPDGSIDARHFNVITYVLPDGRSRGGYKTFGAAIRGAARKLGVPIRARDYRHAYRKCLLEMAENSMEIYNRWLSGECYGRVVELFALSDGEQLESDHCWGFIGEEHAKEDLKQSMDYFWKTSVLKETDVPPRTPGRLILRKRS